MNIITLTLNPALDTHIRCDGLVTGVYNKARLLGRDSGGKGVNLSRALTVNSVDNLCYIMIGREGAEKFFLPLYNIGMSVEYTLIDGSLRENLNVHHGNTDTVIATDGPTADAAAISDMESKLRDRVREGDIVALCGSISGGTDKDAVLAVMHRLKRLGARIVVDSKSFTAEEIMSLKPYLIKPNEEETELLCGIRPRDLGEAARIACAIRDMGVENILVTMGGDGAALASADGAFIATVPEVNVRSTVGAGDSSIAGFLAAVSGGKASAEALASAMAYGAAACMEEGSLPPRPERIAELLDDIAVECYEE